MDERRKLSEGDWRVATQDDGRILVWVANDSRSAGRTSYAALLTHGEATELLETLSKALGQPPTEEPRKASRETGATLRTRCPGGRFCCVPRRCIGTP
jgi:hypothetical protein